MALNRLHGKQKSYSQESSSSSSGGSKGGSQEVVVLTDENFDNLVMKSEDVWFVEFYAPW